jgi:predicted secreted protein
MGEIAGKLQTLTVASASFGLTPEQRQGAETSAQSQAIAQFRQRATEATKSFGYASYSLIEANINSGDSGGGRPPMMAMSARTVATEAPVPLEAGLTSVTVTVSGSVQMK